MTELEKITTQLLELSAEKRAKLAEILIQSLDEKDESEVKTAWLLEVRRRDHEIRAGNPVTKPADEVLRKARAQLRCEK